MKIKIIHRSSAFCTKYMKLPNEQNIHHTFIITYTKKCTSTKYRAVVPISCVRLEERMRHQTLWVLVCSLHMRHPHNGARCCPCVRASRTHAWPRSLCAPRATPSSDQRTATAGQGWQTHNKLFTNQLISFSFSYIIINFKLKSTVKDSYKPNSSRFSRYISNLY